MATISTNIITPTKLSEKLRQIKIMKWLLDVDKSEHEYTYETLEKQITEICFTNSAYLMVIKHYLTQIPSNMMNQINKIISAKSESEKCKKLYFSFIRSFKHNSEFQEYENYIYIQRSKSILENFDITASNFNEQMQEIKKASIEQKSIQLSLIFRILAESDRNLFVKGDIMQNLPQLIYWIEENKTNPIEPLTNDECEIIAGLIYSMTYDDMIEKLNFSSFVKNYTDINEIICELPKKFHVYNITQLIFRILILKPYVWEQCTHEYIVKAIKGVSYV